MPLISIILPTYNVEKYIARALDSCINQTLKDIEIIVVDDKGQDKSIEIAKEYANRDNRIKIVDNGVNLKLLQARENGIKYANAEYIMFLDTDDELELDACETMLNIINQNSNLDMVVSNTTLINDGKACSLYDFKNHQGHINIDDFKNNFNCFGFTVWNKIYKKSDCIKAYEKIHQDFDNMNGGGCNRIVAAEDALFLYYVMSYVNNVYVIDKNLYVYYIIEGSITNTKNIEKLKRNLNSYKDIFLVICENKDNFTIEYFKALKRDYIAIIRELLKQEKNNEYIQEYLEYINSINSDYFNYINEKYYFNRIFRYSSFKCFFLYLYYRRLKRKLNKLY